VKGRGVAVLDVLANRIPAPSGIEPGSASP